MYKIKDVNRIGDKTNIVLRNSRGSTYALGLFVGLFACQHSYAQFVNKGDVKVSDNAVLAIYMDYSNQASGNFVNNGNTYIYQNWNNDGKVSYDPAKNGNTFFEGKQIQQIKGSKQSDFQNVIFNNVSDVVAFNLETLISVGKNSDYKNGIINAYYEDTSPMYGKSKMIFLEQAGHTSAGDQSFVDGMVEKRGQQAFQFPVGNELYFRPTEHAATSSVENVYTTQYFYQNSNTKYPHSNKDESIITINNKEFWNVTQNNLKPGEAGENVVLSLTLDHDTTPSGFYNLAEGTELAIVRWNGTKWVNEGGKLSDQLTGEAFSHLLTGTVTGYGIFTMAIVKKKDEPIDGLIVYNAISPNNDGINDTFHIKGIDKYPDNTVEIYNRWGVKVFDARSYNENDNMFKGYSDGRVTVNRGEKLPTGTYFYILKYVKEGKGEQKSGYLYINNQ